MSTMATQPASLPDWKQEVNRRLAQHKSRKDASAPETPVPTKSPLIANSRAAQAAARVAARYANAPSFSEMQTTEARAALRVAETATRAALEAQAAAQVALANLEACNELEKYEAEIADSVSHASLESHTPQVRFEADAQACMARESASSSQTFQFSPAAEKQEDSPWYWQEFGMGQEQLPSSLAIGSIEPALPIHANLIEFPRELIATRRVRPHNVGEASDAAGQLSIFEVDPVAISTVPDVPMQSAHQTSSTVGPEWSGIKLDDHSQLDQIAVSEPAAQPLNIELAPLHLRGMAALVDLSLIVGLISAFAAAVAYYLRPAFTMRTGEILALAVVVAATAAYHWYFLVKRTATPGMRYAGLDLCTFDDERPTEAQLRHRFYAMLVSVLPLGLGLLWSVFDDDHLSWHDRLSHTYQRRCL